MIRPLIAAAAATVFALAHTTPAHADVTFRIGDVTGLPGQTVSVPVTITTDVGIQAWSYGVVLDAPATIAAIDAGSDTAAFNGGTGPFYSEHNVVSPTTANAGVVIDLLGVEVLGPGAGLQVGVISVTIPAAAALDDVYAINFSNQVGIPPNALVYVLNGASINPDALVAGSVTVVPAPASVALLALGGLAAARRRR